MQILIEIVKEGMIEAKRMIEVDTAIGIEIVGEVQLIDTATAGGTPEVVARRLCALGSLPWASPWLKSRGILCASQEGRIKPPLTPRPAGGL